MQREIKFRAWDKKNLAMREVEAVGFSRKFIIIFEPAGEDNVDQSSTRDFKDVILMQYTGLKDKNGKDIYEGDIVKNKYITGFDAEENYNKPSVQEHTVESIDVVFFRDGEFLPRAEGSFPEDGYYAWRFWDIEVIGNEHENPELMEKL